MNTRTKRLKLEEKEKKKCSCSIHEERKVILVCEYCYSNFPWLKEWKPNFQYSIAVLD